MKTFYDAISDFIFMDDKPLPSDVIFVPGSSRPDHALRAAQLFHEEYAPYILPSGRYSKLVGRFVLESGKESGTEQTGAGETETDKRVPPECGTEWEFLRQVLLEEGVPDEAILKEDRATFTWENAIFSRQVLEKAGLPFDRAILCCQAFHARRAWMYYRQQFPETDILVVPVVTDGISRDNWFLSKRKTDVVLGEVSRIGEQFHCCLPLF